MSDNKTKPTTASVNSFIATIDEKRRTEAEALIAMLQQISGAPAVMWGPSIIGFGSQHYTYDTGREGDMPMLGFSPRKASITIYFSEGFDRYSELLPKLGKFKASVSCLYINKLDDINMNILKQMLEISYKTGSEVTSKPTTVDEYIASVPAASRPQFNELRRIVQQALPPETNEVLSYGIVGYKIDDKRARVYVSGWKDHTAMYPVPKNKALQARLKPYIKGKGTLWFTLDKPLPKDIIEITVAELIK